MLLDDLYRITHLNILVLGPAHVGKSALVQAFVTGLPASVMPPSSPTTTTTFNGLSVYPLPPLSVAEAASAMDTPTMPNCNTSCQLPPSQNNNKPPLSATSHAPYLAPYDPTIEDAHTIQYILPPGSVGLGHSSNKPLTAANVLPTTSNPSNNKDFVHRLIVTLSDVGGHPYYSALWASAIAAADAYILVYDVGDIKSLDRMWPFIKMIAETKATKPQDLCILMIGNMVDTCASASDSDSWTPISSHGSIANVNKNVTPKRRRQVTAKMGQSLADVLEIGWRETTARAPHAVSAAFKSLIAECQIRVAILAKAAVAARNSDLFTSIHRASANSSSNGNSNSPTEQQPTTPASSILRRPSEASMSSRVAMPGSFSSTASSARSSDVYSSPLSRDSMASREGSTSGDKNLTSRSGLGFWTPNHGSQYMQSVLAPSLVSASIPQNHKVTRAYGPYPKNTDDSSITIQAQPLDCITLPPPAKNSIRSKRDMVFAEWQAFKQQRRRVAARNIIRDELLGAKQDKTLPQHILPENHGSDETEAMVVIVVEDDDHDDDDSHSLEEQKLPIASRRASLPQLTLLHSPSLASSADSTAPASAGILPFSPHISSIQTPNRSTSLLNSTIVATSYDHNHCIATKTPSPSSSTDSSSPRHSDSSYDCSAASPVEATMVISSLPPPQPPPLQHILERMDSGVGLHSVIPSSSSAAAASSSGDITAKQTGEKSCSRGSAAFLSLPPPGPLIIDSNSHCASASIKSSKELQKTLDDLLGELSAFETN
ncbi:hypothetical protein SeMB42_g02258 [Synchytrium endobioticum]|nr:hypothetical protein SeMB42_g02258 [Synchytrium endobioticum]